MKPIRNPFLTAIACGAAFITLAASSSAANFFWDADSGTANNQNGDGIWDISNTNWTSTPGGAPNVSWVSDMANTAFIGNVSGTGYDNPTVGGTITLAEDITLFALSMSSGQSGSYVIDGDGNQLILSGTEPQLGNNNSTATLSINAEIAGTDGIKKVNNGRVILNVANSYSGITRVTAGTLAYGVSDAIADGDINISGGSLDLGGDHTDTVGTVTLNGGGGILGTGTSALTTTGSFEMMNGSVTAILAGDADLTKSTVGTVKLSGANAYTGVNFVTAGTLQFANTASLYGGNTSLWTAENLIVDADATLAFNVGGAGEFTSTDLDILKDLGSPSDGFMDGSSLGLDTTNATGGLFSYVSNIGDPDEGGNSLGLTKLGSGSLALTGSLAYTGVTRIGGGALRIGTDSGFFNFNSNHVFDNGVLEGNGTFTATVGSAAGDIQWKAESGRGGFSAVGGDLTVTLNGGAALNWSATAGTDKFGAAALVFGSALSDAKVTLTNGIGMNFTRVVQVDSGVGGDSAELSGILTHSAGGITKNGAGTLILSGANTFGSTNTVNAGTLEARHNTALGNTTGTTTLPAAGGTLALGNNITVAENISISAREATIPQLRNASGDNSLTGALTWSTGGVAYRVQSDAGKLTIPGNINPLGGDKTFNVQGAGNVELAGIITNTANASTVLTLVKYDSGTLILSNPASTYSGPTRILGGTLIADTLADADLPSSIGAAPDFSFNLVLDDGTLRHEAANTTSTNRKFAVGLNGGTIDSSAADPAHTLSFTTNLQMGFNSQEGARTLTLTGTNTGENLVALDIRDDGAGNPTSLVKEGAGTWKLTFPNTYTGGTTVSEGTLILTSDNCLDDSSTLEILDGAVLNLPNEGTDIVGELIIDNDSLPDGLYDEDNTDGAITGLGKIQVGTISSTPFEDWMTDNYPEIEAPDNAPDADADLDGSPNILEFAIMGDPSDPANNGSLAPLIEDTSLKLVVAVRDGADFASGATATVDGITYTVEGSLDLTFPGSAVSSTGPSDTAPVATGLPDLTGTDWEYHTFKLDASAGLTGKGFLRLQVTQP